MRKATYHCHTNFCDGKASIKDMVCGAIDAGFTDIGFSGHSFFYFSSDWHMAVSDYPIYAKEVREAAYAYKNKIKVRLGFEADYVPGLTAPDRSLYAIHNPDYLIGSVHYVLNPKVTAFNPWCVDAPEEEILNGLQNCFGGSSKDGIQAYYNTIREMVTKCDFDIIGHLDLPQKRNKKLRFFDDSADWYKGELEETADCIAKTKKIVEINTGGIARAQLDTLYPSDAFLTLLRARNIPITINSDAHTIKDLDCAYDFAYSSAKKAGYSTIMHLDDDGWHEYPITE